MTEAEAKERAIAWMSEPWDGGPFEDALAALILSVAAEQRERDAVVCDDVAQVRISADFGDAKRADGAEQCAANIRGES